MASKEEINRPKTKVLAIGLDAAEQDLISMWIDSGDLPEFARLRERSVWGRTENEPGLYTGGVWPSIYTGTSAARHGLYYCGYPKRLAQYSRSEGFQHFVRRRL